MATTTPNYGWPVPTSTDYVKDGATAIEALGDAIDATVFANGSSGLTLVTSASFSATSTINVDNCFTSTYRNYIVVLDIRSMTAGAIDLRLRVGGVTTTATNYGAATLYSTTSTVSGRTTGVGQSNLVPNTGQVGFRGNFTILGPQTATKTTWNGSAGEDGGILNIFSGAYTLTTVFDGFSILGASMTGNVQVFGLKN